jgi:oligoendopeptidase F
MTRGTGSSVDDKWGRDPSIQSMRRVFAGMEKAQTELLETLRISLLDHRLRLWRQSALSLFEQQWHQTTRRGYRLDESQITDLYCSCFTNILEKAGIPAPPAGIPSDEEVK